MPTLKQITCLIKYSSKDIKLREYETKFSDGFVTSYVGVPSTSNSFSIHVTSDGYIAPGLAIFVFIDGVPQCNRNRTGLIWPDAGTEKWQTDVEFTVRQKEEKFADGKWLGREWTFASLNVDAADASTHSTSADVLHSVGTIEVVVLRCRTDAAVGPAAGRKDGKKVDKTTNKKADSSTKQKVVFRVKGSSTDFSQLDGGDDDGGRYHHSRPTLGYDGAGDVPPRRPASAADTTTGVPGNDTRYWEQYLAQLPPDGANTSQYVRKQNSRAQPQQQQGQSQAQQYQGHYPPQEQDQRLYYNAPQPAPAQPWQYAPQPQGVGQYQPRPQPHQYEGRSAPYQAHAHGPQEVVPPWAAAQYVQPQRGQVHYGGHINTGTYRPQQADTGYHYRYDARRGSGSSIRDDGRNYRKEKNKEKINIDWNEDNDDKKSKVGDKKVASVAGSATKKDDLANMTWDNDKKEEAKNDDTTAAASKTAIWETTAPAATSGDFGWDDNNNTTDTNPGWGNDNNNDNIDPWGDNKATPTTTKKERSARKKKDKPATDSKPTSAKTSLAKPKPVDPSRPFLKPYFSSWQQDPLVSFAEDTDEDDKGNKVKKRTAYIVPEEPLLQIPQKVAGETQASHQLQAGKGVLYSHRTGRPKYIDRMERPYAVFVFKYRSRDTLATILNVAVEKIKEDKEDIRTKLKDLSREELIEQFIKAKAKAGYDTDSSLDPSSDGDEEDNTDEAEGKSKQETQPESNGWGDSNDAATAWQTPAADNTSVQW